MAVAADNGHPRLRVPQFGSDNVHNSLIGIVEVVVRMPNSWQLFRSVSICFFAIGSANRQTAVAGGHIVVGRGDCPLGSPHLTARQPQTLKRLSAGHFVDELQIDVQNRLSPGLLMRRCDCPRSSERVCVASCCAGSADWRDCPRATPETGKETIHSIRRGRRVKDSAQSCGVR